MLTVRTLSLIAALLLPFANGFFAGVARGHSLGKWRATVATRGVARPLGGRLLSTRALNRARLSDEEDGEEEEDTVPTPNPIIEDDADAISPFKEGIAFPNSLNGSDVRVGIIMARWNADVINGLYKGVNESLLGE